MRNSTRLYFILSILLKSITNLIKTIHLTNFTLYLYKNIILFIISSQVLKKNLLKVFFYIDLNFFVLCLEIIHFLAFMLA